MIPWIMIILGAVSFSSCAKVTYMEEALRLKGYSDETDARDAMIARRKASMAVLVERVASGDPLAELKTKEDLMVRLESPILVEKADGGERWLYRDPVRYFDTPKIYFFLDKDGRVTRWVPAGIVINSPDNAHASPAR